MPWRAGRRLTGPLRKLSVSSVSARETKPNLRSRKNPRPTRLQSQLTQHHRLIRNRLPTRNLRPKPLLQRSSQRKTLLLLNRKVKNPRISPPPPTSEPRQVGLPYSPEECGCEKTKSISVSSAGFSELQAGIKNLGDCVEKFNSIAVTDYSNTLTELSALSDSLRTSCRWTRPYSG